MCFATEHESVAAARWKQDKRRPPHTSVPSVPVRAPMTPKQQAYARAEAARLAKKERRNAAP